MSNPPLPQENLKPTNPKRLSSGPLAVAKFLIETFSTVRKRESPSPTKSSHIRLITIGVSHFCEKVRFALDLLEADTNNPWYYTEDAHPPAFHAYETLKASEQRISATPMILFEENGQQQMMYDSTKILEKFMPQLYPDAIRSKVIQVERDLGQRLGATLRCFAYYHSLSNVKENHDTIVQLCADPNKVAYIESVVFDQFLERGLAAGMIKSMNITKEFCEASEVAVREVFAEWSQHLEETGGEYLLDTKDQSFGFTAADLTFAALAYPVLQPPELRNWCVSSDKVPAALNEMKNELIATKAGQHVLKIYKKHRVPGGEEFVTMKYANRSKSVWDWWKSTGMVSTAVVVAIVLAASRMTKS